MKNMNIKTASFLALITIWLLCSSFMSDFYLKNFVEGFNKECPFTRSPILQMDSAELRPNKVVKFNLTFMMEMDDFKTYFISKTFDKASFLQNVSFASLDRFSVLREMEVKFLFAFHDTKGVEIFRQTITPDDYNSFDKDAITSIEEEMQMAVDQLKDRLPITDPTTGLVVLDCFFDNPNYNIVHMLPNLFVEKVVEPMGKDLFHSMQHNTLIKQQGISFLTNKGVILTYIYMQEDGTELFKVNIDSVSIRNKKTIENRHYEEARLIAHSTIYGIWREIKGLTNEEEPTRITDCYLEGNTIKVINTEDDEFYEDMDKDDFLLLSYPIMKEEMSEDPEVMTMLHNDFAFEYIYVRENGEVFQTLHFSRDDFADADDIWAENTILALVDFFESKLPFANKSSGIYLDTCSLQEEGVVISGRMPNQKQPTEEEIELLKNMLLNTYSKIDAFVNVLELGVDVIIIFDDMDGNQWIKLTFNYSDLENLRNKTEQN